MMKKLGAKFFVVLSLFSVMPSSASEDGALKKRLAEALQRQEYKNGRDVCSGIRSRSLLAKLFYQDDLESKNLFSMLDDLITDDNLLSPDSLSTAEKNLEWLKHYGKYTLLGLQYKQSPDEFDETDCFVGYCYSSYIGNEDSANLFERIRELNKFDDQVKQQRVLLVLGLLISGYIILKYYN